MELILAKKSLIKRRKCSKNLFLQRRREKRGGGL